MGVCCSVGCGNGREGVAVLNLGLDLGLFLSFVLLWLSSAGVCGVCGSGDVCVGDVFVGECN